LEIDALMYVSTDVGAKRSLGWDGAAGTVVAVKAAGAGESSM